MKFFPMFLLLCLSSLVINTTRAFSQVKVPTLVLPPSSKSHNLQPSTLSFTQRQSALGHNTAKTLSSMNQDEEESLEMMLASEKASLLASAFEALEEKDQYDAVLTGLCAKLLDQQPDTNANTDPDKEAERIGTEATLTPTQLAIDRLKDPIRLMGEMNSRNVRASGRSLMALIDATAATQNAKAMSKVLSLALRNGGLSFYGSQQSTITALPPTSSSPIVPGTGKDPTKMTRAERLKSLPSVPTDERSKETLAAIATLGVVGVCLFVNGVGNGLGLDGITPYTSFLLTSIIAIGFVDNFFDLLKSSGSMLVNLNKDKLPDAIKDMKGPEKESMPFALGSGAVTGTVVRGFTRLWSVDTERECQCEAAAFFAAYSLGLPCFAFRPNALEAAVLVFESQQDDVGVEENLLDSLLSDTGIMKMLIWLMAPVAMESSQHPQLIASDPREARGLLVRLKEKASIFSAQEELDSILSGVENDSQEMNDLLKWAYAEADLLLRNNKSLVNDLTERLIGGASTTGDCVDALEQWD